MQIKEKYGQRLVINDGHLIGGGIDAIYFPPRGTQPHSKAI
jgi:hypothetical protein